LVELSVLLTYCCVLGSSCNKPNPYVHTFVISLIVLRLALIKMDSALAFKGIICLSWQHVFHPSHQMQWALSCWLCIGVAVVLGIAEVSLEVPLVWSSLLDIDKIGLDNSSSY
jgi:hypothetical protein